MRVRIVKAQPVQPAMTDSTRQAIALAYGHLWHINNEPLAPIPLRSKESASYAARKLLRDFLTLEERGEAINTVRELLGVRTGGPQPVHGLQYIHDAIMADPSICDIDEPVKHADDFNIRGKLAKLKCWHRLTEAEANDLVAFFAIEGTKP